MKRGTIGLAELPPAFGGSTGRVIDGPTETPSELYEACAATLRSTEDDQSIELLRQLDEGQPRVMLTFFKLLLAEHAELTKVVGGGEGSAALETSLTHAITSLRRQPTANRKDAERLAADVHELDQQRRAAQQAAADATHASEMIGAIESICPRLFNCVASKQFPSAGAYLPTSIRNWLNSEKMSLDYRSGWAFSQPAIESKRRSFRQGA